MFLKLILVLCASYVPFTCSGRAGHHCFPTNNIVNNDKKWRYTSPESNTIGLFNAEVEAGINKQINAELSASYAYLSMSYHFEQDEIYMPGFSKFFKKMSEEEHEHAQMFMKYQNKRGGRIRLHNIPVPCDDGDWGNGTTAMKAALKLEKHINSLLLELHSIGDKNSEHQFLDFLESNFLGEQVESIKELANYVNILNRLGKHDGSLGEYQFDKLTLGGGKD